MSVAIQILPQTPSNVATPVVNEDLQMKITANLWSNGKWSVKFSDLEGFEFFSVRIESAEDEQDAIDKAFLEMEEQNSHHMIWED